MKTRRNSCWHRTGYLIVLSYFVFQSSLLAQTEAVRTPVIGRMCPDFNLAVINHNSIANRSLKDFKGQFLILDFWTMHCGTCVRNFPHNDQLQKEFSGKLKILLVGFNGEHENIAIQKMYAKYEKKYALNLSIAFDSVLFEHFKIFSVPHLIWIDSFGVVRAITYNSDLNSENIQAFISGINLNLPQKLNDEEITNNPNAFDFTKTFLVDGNGGNDTNFVMRSVLTKYARGVFSIGFVNRQPLGFIKPNQILLLNKDLGSLYLAAYGDTLASYMPGDPDYGKYWVESPILEMRDSSAFQPSFSSGENLYCYNLSVSLEEANKGNMQKIMQQDLEFNFGYIIKVENRVMPYWRLVASQKAKLMLKSKGGEPHRIGSFSGFKMINLPIYDLIITLWGQFQNEPPILDETGIAGTIDITLDSILTDFSDIKKALQDNGLNLVKGEKEMKVIIIKDKDFHSVLKN
ncbi:MAG TPA: redoxin domain-containing protein [Puia sp.]|nr:redoxin domain-containing protein [Puia sp.]